MSQSNQSSDSAAIQALIPELRVAARDLLNGSTISPDDLVQGALMVALKNWDRLPSPDALKPWLLGVLRDPSLVERAKQVSAPAAECG
jgi:DNA-directed RNA polymerase specialized sigma24 family protein